MGVEEQGMAGADRRYQVIPRVLIFITNNDDVLLLKGAPTKRIWPNLYNGVGGHVEAGETIREAALREVAEEVGLTDPQDLSLRGIVNITTDHPHTGIMMFVFTARSSSRTITASAEGTSEWVDWQALDSQSMVSDLPIIIPRALGMAADDPPFYAHYWYDEHNQLQVRFNNGN